MRALKRQARNWRSVESVGCLTRKVDLQRKGHWRASPGVLEGVARASRQRGHAEQTATIGLVVAAASMLLVIKIARMVVVDRLVLVCHPHSMVVMRQAVHNVLCRREGDGDGRCRKRKDSEGGDPDRHIE